MVVNKTLQNMSLTVQGHGHQRILTLYNRGDQRAYINLGIVPTDQRSMPLQRWGTFNQSEDELTLNPNERKEVILSFNVPPQAEPGFYSYQLQMKSSQYPEEDIRRLQQLEVQPSPHIALLRTEPKLSLSPATTSESPYQLKPGESVLFDLSVENLSQRTDAFTLTCSDLPADWFKISYQDTLPTLPGEQTFTKGLQLNPQETGHITLRLEPPKHALAGDYFPTLRFSSHNRESLVLLKVIYFSLEVDTEVLVSLTPGTLPIPDPIPGQAFHITFSNEGNIQRHLTYEGWDAERLLRYQLDPPELTLAPGTQQTAQLTVQPRKFWHRLWRLKEHIINFELRVNNAPVFQPVENTLVGTLAEPWAPELPQPVPTGTVVLKIRRRWLFRLLVLLAGAGLLLGVASAVWWFFFWKPHNRPKVTYLSTVQETYQEGSDESIQINLDIINADEIGAIIVSHKDQDSQATYVSEPLTVQDLIESSKCSVEHAIGDSSILQTLFNFQRERSQTTQKILKCREFGPDIFVSESLSMDDAKRYVEALKEPRDLFVSVADTNAENQDERLKKGLHNNVFTRGNYSLSIEVMPIVSQEERVTVTKTENAYDIEAFNQKEKSLIDQTIEISPKTLPLITYLENSQSTERTPTFENDTNNIQKVVSGLAHAQDRKPDDIAFFESVEVLPPAPAQITKINAGALEYRTEPTSNRSQPAPTGVITLDWEIINLENIDQLSLISVSPSGSQNTVPVIFEFDAEQSPEEKDNGTLSQYNDRILKENCKLNKGLLQCQNISTTAKDIGEYIFILTAIPKGNESAEPVVNTTPTISIKPPTPHIIDFTLEDKSVQTTPQQIFVVNPALGLLEVELTWAVEDVEKVEILPAPGPVSEGPLTYTLSAAPGNEMITLRASNALGEEVTQSVVIEKIEYIPGIEAPFTSVGQSPIGLPPGANGSPGSAQPVPSIFVPELEPLRSPPQAD